MNPPTPEELAAMKRAPEIMAWLARAAEENETRSAAVLEAETAFGEHYPVLKHQPLTRQVTHILSRLQRFRELMMENDKLKIDLAQARRENETLARQVPPEPPKRNLPPNVTADDRISLQETTIRDLRDLLTSAHAIAARGGEGTNWDAFLKQLRARGIGSVTAKTFRLPKDYAFKSLGTDGGRVENPEPTFVTGPATHKITQILGQAWCRTEKDAYPQSPGFDIIDGDMVLCNVHQNILTGEVTYVPISFDDLPRVTESPAS